MGLQLGEKIWCESLLTPQEWREQSKIYSTYCTSQPPTPFHSEYRWRQGMGAPLSASEIEIINTRLNEVLLKVRK